MDKRTNIYSILRDNLSLPEGRSSDWVAYVAHVGVDPLLQGVPFGTRSRLLIGFAQQVQEGYYGCRTTISAGIVCTAITAIEQMIAMAHQENPTKTR